MITTILQGILMGFVLSLMVGPIFFQLIQITIDQNPRMGLIYVAGAWLSDLLSIVLVIIAWSKISEIEAQYHTASGLISGIVLLAFGIGSFFKKATVHEVKPIQSTSVKSMYFMTGFVVNSLNPMALLYWLAIASNMSALNVKGNAAIAIYFACIWLTLIGVDFLKMAFAKKLKENLNPNKLSIVNKLMGAALFGSGILMLVRLWKSNN
jgi:threonine/homoserine/homoserine lactone efflux protein